ncbi:MAG: hypothetical protein KIT09_06330 [Bryobacteraceae bacterium]|nr:hypothetical protein [Bryobacteraceae bacterium]
MNTALYLLGYALVLAGLIYGSILMGIPPRWIVAGTLVVVGMGVLKAVRDVRMRGSG